MMNEIHRNEQVIVCPSCHRILFMRSADAVEA
jgi:predicted  nucleic acid-binding Zn-ribbon protein